MAHYVPHISYDVAIVSELSSTSVTNIGKYFCEICDEASNSNCFLVGRHCYHFNSVNYIFGGELSIDFERINNLF